MTMKSVLILEDEGSMAMLYKHAIRAVGGEAFHVSNVGDALAVVGDFRVADVNFDLVIVDIRIPKVSGMELIKVLKSQGNTVPIVVITADNSSETHNNATRLGAQEVFVKPLSYRNLKDIFAKYLT